MKLYIECFYEDGSQILGNGDGQAVMWNVRDYKRTNAYKWIKRVVAEKLRKTIFAKVVTESGRVLETIKPASFTIPLTRHCFYHQKHVPVSQEFGKMTSVQSLSKGDSHGQGTTEGNSSDHLATVGS